VHGAWIENFASDAGIAFMSAGVRAEQPLTAPNETNTTVQATVAFFTFVGAFDARVGGVDPGGIIG
jgi:hypothetical protein